MKAIERQLAKHGILYGFKKETDSVTGYLRIMPKGQKGSHGQYDIVEEEGQASIFPAKARGAWNAAKICKFMNAEEELADWKFHVVWKHCKK